MELGHPVVDLGSLVSIGTNTRPLRFWFIEAPVSGAFVVVTAMLETTDFFQDQVKQCRKLAADAHDKNDREFWLRLAHRWEGLLRAQQHDGGGVETVQKLRFERPIFAKRRRAA
ncbi:MAG: hypothetical protein WAV38_01450 [Xanthobacteraceae bacterium]